MHKASWLRVNSLPRASPLPPNPLPETPSVAPQIWLVHCVRLQIHKVPAFLGLGSCDCELGLSEHTSK